MKERQVPELPELLDAMGETVVPREDARTSNARRARVVGAMRVAIAHAAEDRARRVRRMRVASGMAAAAALAIGVGVAWRSRAPAREVDVPAAMARVHGVGAVVMHEGHAAAATGDVELRGGDEITTEATGKSEVTLADGVAMALDGASHVRLPPAAPNGVAPAHEEVAFDAGTLRVRVPKLAQGHTFSVRTPDAIVTVHGTAFRVDVLPNATTRVEVTEGVVSVVSGGREALLTAGMQWHAPVTDAPSAAAPASPAPSAPVASAPRAGTKPHHRAWSHERAADPIAPSSLAEQNRLLASAMDASRAGDDKRAIERLTELLARYPTSPLAQEATVQRFRALERTGDHREAARQARQYLAAYPSGFAREEAKSLAFEP